MCVRWALCHPMMFLPLRLCTNDLALAKESRYLNRHNGGIFSQVRGGQSMLGCDMHCNLVFMRVRRLTFSLPNPLHEWRSDIWVINTVNQRWLIHFSSHSAVRWHQQGGNWIWLALIIQSGNLLPTDMQNALNLSASCHTHHPGLNHFSCLVVLWDLKADKQAYYPESALCCSVCVPLKHTAALFWVLVHSLSEQWHNVGQRLLELSGYTRNIRLTCVSMLLATLLCPTQC